MDPMQQHNAEEAAKEAARLAGGEFRPEYNGWPNRETWNTNLWMTNEQGLDEAARAIVAEAYANAEPYPSSDPDPKSRAAGERRARIYAASVALEEWYGETFYPGAPDEIQIGPIDDAWTYALACVDWYSIAEGLAEE